MKHLVLIIGLLLLCSCTEEVVNKPEDLIPENVMVDIYFDISLINAARNSGYDKFKENGINTKEYLYNKYGIDSARLATSATYYTSRPLTHERIYTRVEERLDSLKSGLDTQMNELNEQRDKVNAAIDSLEQEKDSIGK